MIVYLFNTRPRHKFTGFIQEDGQKVTCYKYKLANWVSEDLPFSSHHFQYPCMLPLKIVKSLSASITLSISIIKPWNETGHTQLGSDKWNKQTGCIVAHSLHLNFKTWSSCEVLYLEWALNTVFYPGRQAADSPQSCRCQRGAILARTLRQMSRVCRHQGARDLYRIWRWIWPCCRWSRPSCWRSCACCR